MSIQQKVVGVLLCVFMMGSVGCGFNQTTKNVWKDTKGFWYGNVNVPATIDYDDTGSLEEYEEKLSLSMIGIDAQLTALEKTMVNADKPPTIEWMRELFARYPWLSGFSGIKADGTLLGQMPGPPIKALDFYPLLEADPKQNARALRGHVQDTAMGPEVFLATPLYDAHSFLGIVTTYFDMRALLEYSTSPEELIIIAPNALLWAGKYNFASTPMAGIAWDTIVLEENSGTVSNATGTFYWSMRYLGNVPLIFAVSVEGTFGEEAHPRTGPTSQGPFITPKPLKMPPAPELEPIPLAKPKPVVRQVQRQPLPEPFVPPVEPAPEPVRMPSPFGPQSSSTDAEEKPETSSAPSTAPKEEAPKEESPEVENNEESGATQPAVVRRPSPFGPQ